MQTQKIHFIGIALFALVVTVLCPGTRALAINYGSGIVVDGDTSDWSLDDYFADMYRAGDPGKQVESNLYLRYDCTAGKMYALVLTVPDVTALEQPDNAFIKINGAKMIDGNHSSQFAWVYDGEVCIGWEACFAINEGSYTIEAHIQVQDGGKGNENSAQA